MQFPHSSNHDSASDGSGSPRIEPTIGESKPAPWDVKPEAAPAFELVEEPADEPVQDWDAAEEPSADEQAFDTRLATDGRSEPTFYEPGSEPVNEPLPDVGREEAELPGFTESRDEVANVPPESLMIPTEESASIAAPSLTEEPKAEEAAPSATQRTTAAVAAGTAAAAAASAAGAKEDEKKLPGFFAFMKKGAEEARAKETPDEAEAPSEEQLAAREKTRNRLIGAAAILMAVVVSSSFILDNEELVKGEANVSTAIPPVPEKSAMAVEKPVTSNVVTPKAVVPAKTETPKVANATAPKKTEKKVEKKAEAKPDKKKPAEPAKKAAPRGYFIQIVVTSSEQKAERMVHDLKRLKLPAYSEQIKGKKGPLWRVRIGHFKTEKEAKNTVAVLALNGYTGKHYIDKQ